MRFVGDAVAIVAGEDGGLCSRAMRLIKVKYEVLEPVLDMHDAKDGDILVHPEEDWKALCPLALTICAISVPVVRMRPETWKPNLQAAAM